ncbi:Pyridoxal phosphate-dependent transferase major region subdomain 1 [Penicillium malachiteum]|uniref:Pyridoxal phosphate-dependent transferase major region subdomain 1 n=1 Tax=Penicillium malachiteum TaxID=1324776 RepID=A0AAD6HCE9_9EURO|nr:Pyridoxal phosphate-dependent transferase major region subdomain 1 [Penicillium malachiteum]
MTAPPIDLSHHFSYTAKNRAASFVKAFYKYYQIPGIANFAGGLPHPSYFPYDTLEANVARPQRLQPVTAGDSKPERVTVPKLSEITDVQRRIDLTTALQYGTAEGYPALLSFLRQFVRKHLHPNVPYEGGPEIVLSCGNTDGFSKAIELFTNVWNPDRDWIRQREGVLCEEFSYMNAIQTAKPRGLNIVGVAMDGEGMCAFGKGGLADILENWDARQGRRPHLMYTVTIGQNPTGGVLSIQRKKAIYALCQQYDVIIVEDEPYWNLQFPSAYEMEANSRGLPTKPPQNYNVNGKSSGYQFLDSLAPSYLSIDTEGRVVRLDTFSKTIAPGSRLGWITAQSAIIERITRITEVSTQQPSGFVQSVIAEMLMGKQNAEQSRIFKTQGPEGWQMDGWVRWLEGLRAGYEKRMQAMCNVLEESKFLFSEESESSSTSETQVQDWEVVDRVQMFDFVWPKAGMFTWIKVDFETHPLRPKYSAQKLSKAFWIHLTQKPALCLVGPGSMFAPTPKSVAEAHKYLRLSFAPMDADEVAPFTNRLVEGFRSFWRRKDLDGLDDDLPTLEMHMHQLGPGANFLGTGC